MMCNFKTCFWEVFKFTSNFLYTVRKNIASFAPNELSILVHNNFLEVRNDITYYIYKDNEIIENTSLLTLTNIEELKKITTNFFIPYIILYYKNTCINLELQGHDYTYYIVGNIINRELITFYMDKKENIELKSNEPYTIEFINSDFQTTIITDDSEIVLDKDSYKLL